jgi:6-phosphogluconolactonase
MRYHGAMPEPRVITATTEKSFVLHGLTLLIQGIEAAIDDHGVCVIGLSGGSTPRPIYEELGKETEIDWHKVWIFLADERHISPASADSNTKLLYDTVLRGLGADAQCVLPDTSLPAATCAADYGKRLQKLFDDVGGPDILTLGLGDDGHIASLFPPVPPEAFGKGYALHTTTETFAVRDRISVSMPVLKSAREKMFFLKGEAKKKVWEEMLASPEPSTRWPAKDVITSGGSTVLIL